MPETIVVTGASSYLGRRAVGRLAASGTRRVVALLSPRAPRADLGPDRIAVDLALDLPTGVRSALAAADRVLHFAWDRSGDAKGDISSNAAMIDALMPLCRPGAFVFVSSVAGAPDAASSYGQHKHALAGHVLRGGGSVFVPGLVVEDPPAGPYAILTRVVARLPVALRLGAGASRVYPVPMERLLDMIEAVADPALGPGSWRGFGDPVPFDDFLAGIEARYPRRRLPVRVSARLLMTGARAVKALPLPTRGLCDKVLTFLHKNDAYLATLRPLPDLRDAPPRREARA